MRMPGAVAAGIRKPPREETAPGELEALPRALRGFDGRVLDVTCYGDSAFNYILINAL